MRDIVINATPLETRLAVKENHHLSEFYVERTKEQGIVGNIYVGKVLKVLPGIEASFVDIGQERAGFLYVNDIAVVEPQAAAQEPAEPNGTARKKRDIETLVREGQSVLVQVSKGPIGGKGARITGNISIPGRNLVLMPFASTLGISRQIGPDPERRRLREIVQRIRPQGMGLIVRTVANEQSEQALQQDIDFLVSIWESVQRSFENQQAPALVHADLSLVFRILRDSLSPNVRRVVVDDPSTHAQIKGFLRNYLPSYASVIEQYRGDQPIFEGLRLEEEIIRCMSRKVYLPSGGHLVIDQTEALTAIDVNTGRFVGRGSTHAETILKNNLEAAHEVVQQLKLRNIGGIIIIDFIDMDSTENQQHVYRALKDALKQDRTRSKILQISEIGLVEMTRQREQENLLQSLSQTCPYCEGAGSIKSFLSIGLEIFRELQRLQKRTTRPMQLVARVHPDIADYLQHDEPDLLRWFEDKLNTSLRVCPERHYHHHQFEVFELTPA